MKENIYIYFILGCNYVLIGEILNILALKFLANLDTMFLKKSPDLRTCSIDVVSSEDHISANLMIKMKPSAFK